MGELGKGWFLEAFCVAAMLTTGSIQKRVGGSEGREGKEAEGVGVGRRGASGASGLA
jgi:hypothetical protein